MVMLLRGNTDQYLPMTKSHLNFTFFHRLSDSVDVDTVALSCLAHRTIQCTMGYLILTSAHSDAHFARSRDIICSMTCELRWDKIKSPVSLDLKCSDRAAVRI